jgi:hypothetical protein
MTNWPDHTPEPGESPRWLGWGVAAGLIGAILLWAPEDNNWFGEMQRSWQLPQFTLPEFSMPELNLPDLDLRGRSETPAETSPEIAAISEALTNSDLPLVEQQVPFEACRSMLADTGNSFGQQPLLSVESSDARQIAVFKFLEGDLTITCTTEGAMTVQRRP